MMTRLCWLAAPLAAGLVAAGCGGGTAQVTGKVTFDGKPVEMGSVTFEPADGAGPKVGTRFFQGEYTIEPAAGLAPGKYKVMVSWLRNTGRKITTGDGPPMDEIVEGLPDKYNKATTLTAEVKAGSNTLDFTLTK